MALAFVQQQSAQAAAGEVTATYDTAPTQNNLLIAVVSATTLAATVGITGWEIADAEDNAGCVKIFFKIAGASEPSAVTATATGSGATQIHIYEFSGNVTTTPHDQQAGANSGLGTTRSQSTGTTGTTAQADELLLAGVSVNGSFGATPTWSNSFTGGPTGANRLASAYRIVAATGTYETTADWTAGSLRRAQGTLVTFKADTGAAVGHPAHRRWGGVPGMRLGRGGGTWFSNTGRFLLPAGV